MTGYYAKMNGITTSPTVELYTVINGDHVIPNPRYDAPRILGFSTHDLDTPRVIWRFFEGLPARTPAGL